MQLLVGVRAEKMTTLQLQEKEELSTPLPSPPPPPPPPPPCVGLDFRFPVSVFQLVESIKQRQRPQGKNMIG